MHFSARGLRLVLFSLAGLVVLALAGFVDGETLDLLPVADTTLFQLMPDNNLGAIATLVAGTTLTGYSNRALIKFDVAQALPGNATLVSATLHLTVTRTIASGPALFRIHRVARNWVEGTGNAGNTGGLAQPGETTWTAASYPDEPWFQPGGGAGTDYVATPSAEVTLGDTGVYEAHDSGLLADVQGWLTNRAGNFGWIVVCADEIQAPTSRRLGAREDSGNAPTLTVEYTVPERLHAEFVAAADTALFEHLPNNNLGACDLASGSIGLDTNRSRALFRFDVAGNLPPDAYVTSASLGVFVTRNGQGPGTVFELHRLLQDWGEGNKVGIDGDLATDGEATWFARFGPDVLWSQPGAAAPEDYLEAITSTTFINLGGWWVFPHVEADVRYWQTNTVDNHGWILVDSIENVPRTARRFGARESAGLGPTLFVEYVLPPQIDSVAWTSGGVDLTFSALARNRYRIQASETLPPVTWDPVARLEPAVSGPVTVHLPAASGRKFYRVELMAD